MDDKPAAPIRRPVTVFDVLAIVEYMMRVRLLNAESLDLEEVNAVCQGEIVYHDLCLLA